MAENLSPMTPKDLKSRAHSSYKNVRNAKQPKMLDNGSSGVGARSIIVSVLGAFLLVCLLATFIASARGSSNVFTFTGFLEYLNSSPSFNFIPLSTFEIVGDWGLFDFLRNFFNLFGATLAFSIWICQLFVNLISWLIYFFKFFFFM